MQTQFVARASRPLWHGHPARGQDRPAAAYGQDARATSAPQRLFFRNAAQVLTLAGGPVPRRGAALGELGVIRSGAVLTEGSRIALVGSTRSLERQAFRMRAEAVDCSRQVVMPGFVDSHTHLVFAGNRVDDYELRLRGRTYEEISRAGGGIQSSAEKVRIATQASLVQQATFFLAQFAAHGTTTLEVKSGYGLEFEQEIKILRAIRTLQRESALELVPTLLAAHALPKSHRNRRSHYLGGVIKNLVPLASRAKLAEFVDVFCDSAGFDLEECRQLLAAGARHGLVPRIHAEQLSRTGAALLAIEVGAASADHLDKLTAVDIRALAHSDTVATLLPAANFHLGWKDYPPARRLIDSGAAVALATDFNPGTSPTVNMQFVLSLACTQMGMTSAEAIAAATINGACALRRDDRIGLLEPGKQADLVVMDLEDYREIPYYFGVNHCATTVKEGRVVYRCNQSTVPNHARTLL